MRTGGDRGDPGGHRGGRGADRRSSAADPVLAAEPGRLLKLEFTQHTGSFKARGAMNRLLVAGEAGELPATGPAAAGIVAASGGNAGLAFAYAAREVGVRAEIHVPRTAPAVKMARLRALGGGGLVAGIAAALAGRARVVAVEPEQAPTLHAALAAGGPVDVPVSGVAADSLGARRAGAIAYQIAVETGVGSVLVPDAAIVAARALLWDRYRLAVEHGAAAAMAALDSGAYRPGDGERVAVVLCGANTDPSDLPAGPDRNPSAQPEV